MNDDIVPLPGAPSEPVLQAQELADCLNLLEDVDRQVTPEHVAGRFQELLRDVGHRTVSDVPDSREPAPQARVHISQPDISSSRSERLKPAVPGTPDPAAVPPAVAGLAALKADPVSSAIAPESVLDAILEDPTSTGAVPGALRPVANLLAALRAAPSSKELAGEAMISAVFRATTQSGRATEMPARQTRSVDRQSRGRRRRRRRLPVLAAFAAAAAAVIALMSAAYSGALPAPVQNLAHVVINAPPASGVATGTVINGGEKITIRNGPGASYGRIGWLAPGAVVSFSCYEQGSAVTGPDGTETIWDRLISGGFVPDVWIYTGSNEPVVPACDSS
jgi:hypothetical protein